MIIKCALFLNRTISVDIFGKACIITGPPAKKSILFQCHPEIVKALIVASARNLSSQEHPLKGESREIDLPLLAKKYVNGVKSPFDSWPGLILNLKPLDFLTQGVTV